MSINLSQNVHAGYSKFYHGEFIKISNHIIHPLEYPFDLKFKYFNAKMNMIMTDILFVNNLSNKSIMLHALYPCRKFPSMYMLKNHYSLHIS